VKVGLFAAGFESDVAATLAARARALREQGARIVVLLFPPSGPTAFTAAQALLPSAREAGRGRVVLGRRDDPAADPNAKDPGLAAAARVEGNGQSLLRLDVHLGDGPCRSRPPRRTAIRS